MCGSSTDGDIWSFQSPASCVALFSYVTEWRHYCTELRDNDGASSRIFAQSIRRCEIEYKLFWPPIRTHQQISGRSMKGREKLGEEHSLSTSINQSQPPQRGEHFCAPVYPNFQFVVRWDFFVQSSAVQCFIPVSTARCEIQQKRKLLYGLQMYLLFGFSTLWCVRLRWIPLSFEILNWNYLRLDQKVMDFLSAKFRR